MRPEGKGDTRLRSNVMARNGDLNVLSYSSVPARTQAHERAFANWAVALACIWGLISGCASQRLNRDPLCAEIAAFANATKPGETHLVSLETAWGPTGKHPDSLRSLDCEDGGYAPGNRLCAYLLANSGAEFPTNNLLAALACLKGTPEEPENYVNYERLEVRVSAYNASGVRGGVEVSLEFKPNEANGTMQLDIGAASSKPKTEGNQ